MITLYQLHWSHYVEKVRWALDYKGVEWTAVDVDPFTKREMHHLPCKSVLDSGKHAYIVPAIHDATTGAVVSDSSAILDYLERTYPTPALYPADAIERAEVTRWISWLDSALGLAARRLAYTQIALEHPGLLGVLFIPDKFGKDDGQGLKARYAGAVIGGVLARRFAFLRNRADRVFEQLEHCLLIVAERLKQRRYLVGERFTAADLTLAALLRPTQLVPFFSTHPQLQQLFDWRATQLREHGRPMQNAYESAMHDQRRRRGWALGEVSWLPAPTRSDAGASTEIPGTPATRNDQRSVGRQPLLTGALWYLWLSWTCGLRRTSYPR